MPQRALLEGKRLLLAPSIQLSRPPPFLKFHPMLAILSPAKTLDYSPQNLVSRKTKPGFLQDSEELICALRKLSARDLRELMGISPALADLNHQRFQRWTVPFPRGQAKQALSAFKGDVYRGFKLASFRKEDWDFAQDHLRILSGLYGTLRPLDAILPYRLEMGTKLATHRGSNLYEFWGTRITESLNKAIRKQGDDILLNLASNEYFRAVKPQALKGRLVNAVFKDTKNGKLKVINFYAKHARGMMADFVIRHRLTRVDDLKGFNEADYGFDDTLSDESTLVFTRGGC